MTRTHRHPALFGVAVLALTLIVAGCGGGKDDTKAEEPKAAPASGTMPPSTLMVNGKVVPADGSVPEAEPMQGATPKTEAAAKKTAAALDDARLVARVWPDLPLFEDGTIDDGDDPFAGGRTQVLPAPIEDDPESTRAIDAWTTGLRSIDSEQWSSWMADGSAATSRTGPAEVVNSMVRVSTQRCGGATTVATGVVLGEETVVTTVHAIESAGRRVRVEPLGQPGNRIPAMIRYLDVDDDIAILRVPGLTVEPLGTHVPQGTDPQRAFAFGVASGGTQGSFRRVPVFAAMAEGSLTTEQPDGFAQEISDRSVYPLAGAIDTGFSGGVVAATNDPALRTGWGFHGLVRARVPYRAAGGGIAIPSRLVTQALQASADLDEWYEHRPGGCPQWRRPSTKG